MAMRTVVSVIVVIVGVGLVHGSAAIRTDRPGTPFACLDQTFAEHGACPGCVLVRDVDKNRRLKGEPVTVVLREGDFDGFESFEELGMDDSVLHCFLSAAIKP